MEIKVITQVFESAFMHNVETFIYDKIQCYIVVILLYIFNIFLYNKNVKSRNLYI